MPLLVRPVPQQTRFSWRFIAGATLCVLAVMAWRMTRAYPTGVFDFYPLYYGAQAWLHTGNAYALDTVVPASHHAYQLYQIGNIYPLPAVLLALPLSFLPPQAAGTVLLGLVTAGLLFALRLHRWPLWFLLYLPVIEGVRIEQYTIVVLILQMIAVWALREQRYWLLAVCCALIVTKPNQGFIFVLVLVLLARNWRQQAIVGAAVWGGSLLLDPNWVVEWIPTLVNHHNVLHQPFLWPVALLALPLLLARDFVGAAVVLQFLILPYPGIYAASAVPLSVLDDPRSKWLLVFSIAWIFPAALIGQEWATGLLLVLPMVALSLLRWWEGRVTQQRENQVLAPEPQAG